MPERRCRQSERKPFDYIIARRCEKDEKEPGPGALRKPCSDCGHEVWVHPTTVADTGLRSPILCWECAEPKLQEDKELLFILPRKRS